MKKGQGRQPKPRKCKQCRKQEATVYRTLCADCLQESIAIIRDVCLEYNDLPMPSDQELQDLALSFFVDA